MNDGKVYVVMTSAGVCYTRSLEAAERIALKSGGEIQSFANLDKALDAFATLKPIQEKEKE